MKKQILFIITGILVFTSCIYDECKHDNKLGIAVRLDLTGVTEQINDAHLYIFDASDRLDVYRYFPSQAEMEAERLYIDNGNHTVVVVLNVGKDFPMPESKVTKADELPHLMLNDFIVWLKNIAAQYPNMMTGISTNVVYEGGRMTIVIEISEGTSGINFPILRLKITIPDEEMPDFNSRVPNHNLRTVVEVYKKGTVLRVHSKTEILKNNTLDLYLQPGDYDILVWADFTPSGSIADYHYSTSSLRGITFNEEYGYVAGVNSRNAFGLNFDVTVIEQPITEKQIALEALLAKYRIVATDVKSYMSFIEEKNYPPLDELLAIVSYEGFFPNSYDVRTGSPNNSGNAEPFSSSLKDITDTTATIISDYIFANNTDSYIYATVTIANKNGDVLTSVPGVKIEYHRGYITTVESDYLTAGVINKGITIDTEWEGVIEVTF